MHLNTLRFFRHADPEADRKVNGHVNILNLERVDHDDIQVEGSTCTHRPIGLCPLHYYRPDTWFHKPLMVIHHYIGTWEQCKLKLHDGR